MNRSRGYFLRSSKRNGPEQRECDDQRQLGRRGAALSRIERSSFILEPNGVEAGGKFGERNEMYLFSLISAANEHI